METHTYHYISGLGILNAARNGGYLVWHDGDVAWRTGMPIRDPQTLAWQLAADDGTYEIVAAGIQLARAVLGPRQDAWEVMAVAFGRRVFAIARTAEARDYVWQDAYIPLIIYPDQRDVYGRYDRGYRAVWHTMPDDV